MATTDTKGSRENHMERGAAENEGYQAFGPRLDPSGEGGSP